MTLHNVCVLNKSTYTLYKTMTSDSHLQGAYMCVIRVYRQAATMVTTAYINCVWLESGSDIKTECLSGSGRARLLLSWTRVRFPQKYAVRAAIL